MGYLGRRIGLSQDQGDSNPGAAGGAVGGGLLDLIAHGYFERQGDLYNAPGVVNIGLTATGGVISDYTSGPAVYRAHVFTSSGIFNVSALGSFGANIDYLVVGGGGGAAAVHGSNGTGGAGGGGLRTNMPACPYAQAAFLAPGAKKLLSGSREHGDVLDHRKGGGCGLRMLRLEKVLDPNCFRSRTCRHDVMQLPSWRRLLRWVRSCARRSPE